VLSAVNDAITRSKALERERMTAAAGGVPGLGGAGFPGR
jgi:DNA-binding protein YbaB